MTTQEEDTLLADAQADIDALVALGASITELKAQIKHETDRLAAEMKKAEEEIESIAKEAQT